MTVTVVMWVGYWKRQSLLISLILVPIYLALSPIRSNVPCSFRLGSGASWLEFPNQRFTVTDSGALARRGTMGAVSPLRRLAEPRSSWLTSSWSRTGVAEMRESRQETPSSWQLASQGVTGAAVLDNHSKWRLTSSRSRTGVAVEEYPKSISANDLIFQNFSDFSKFSEEDTEGITQGAPSEFITLHTEGITQGAPSEFSANFSERDNNTAVSTLARGSKGITQTALDEVASMGITHAMPTFKMTLPHSEQLVIAIIVVSILVVTSAAFCHMVNPGGDTNNRVPPRWGPERETTYSFKTYVTDLMLWVMLTDLAPHQQVAAIILRLEGAARELARTLTPQEITQGGMINGVMVDPVSYIVYGLHARFAQLGEESRLVAMTEMLSFARKPHESINEVLTRYEIVRQRARLEGQFVMSSEGCALQLLRACGVNTTQLMQLLQPFNTNLPRNEQELSAMANSMRRMGHILENTPGNIASSLRGHHRHGSHLLADVFVSMDSEQATAYQSSQGWNGQERNHDLWRNLTPAPEGMYDQYNANMYDQYNTSMYDQYNATAAPSQPASSSWETGYQGNWEWGNSGITTEAMNTAYLGNTGDLPEAEYETGTDTDTSSDSGHEQHDMSEHHGLNNEEASELAFWQYRTAKRKWRRITNKPTRKFRRLTRKIRRKGKGKGFRSSKGFGKGKGIFLSAEQEREAALTYLKGKGKGKRKGSSGKGTGRRKNPMGRDGQIMRCRVCGSDEHFAARCPQAGSGGSSSSGPQMFILQDSTDGPLSDLLRASERPNSQTMNPERSSLNFHFLALRTQETREEDPLAASDPWQASGSSSGNSHFGPSRPRNGQGARRPGLRAPGEFISSSGAAPSRGFLPATPVAPEPAPQGTSFGGSAFMQQAHESGGFTTATAPPAPPAGQTVINSGTANLTDTQLQHLLTSHQLVHDLRDQHREHVRGRRAVAQGNNAAPLYTLPTFFQQMASSGPGPLAMGTSVTLPGTGVQAWMNNPPVADPATEGVPAAQVPQQNSLFTNGVAEALQEAAPTREVGNPFPVEDVRNAFLIPTPPEENHPPAPPEPVIPAPQTPVIFDGDNRSCTVCIQDFEHGQRVVRLRCRHVFHGDCWMAVHVSHTNRAAERLTLDNPECPNCRGVGEIIALWDFIDPQHVTQPGADNLLVGSGLDQLRGRPSEAGTSTPTRPRSESQWGTPDSNASRQNMYRAHRSRSASQLRPRHLPPSYLILPSTYLDANDWSVQDPSPGVGVSGDELSEIYHSGTRLPDGRPVLLIDPGSVGNLGGDRWARECAQVAIAHGRNPSQARRPRPLSVMGVGNGNQTCTHNCTLPIGLIRSNGEAHHGSFTTPVVENSDLPGLMGLHTMRNNRCVLDMVNLQLHMCGPDDVQLSVPAGTETYQLELAPSGHLVLPCGNFQSPPRNQLNTSELVLQSTTADNQVEQPSSSSGVHL